MAIQYIGNNIITKGGNGGFETDPSGWGLNPVSNFSVVRSSEQKYEGAHSARFRCNSVPNPAVSRQDLMWFNFTGTQIGKKYEFALYVKSLSNNPIASDTNSIAFEVVIESTFYDTFEILEQGVVSIPDSKNVWTKIFCRVEKTGTGFYGDHVALRVKSPIQTAFIIGGDLFIDKATGYEYQIVEDPIPDPDPDPDPGPEPDPDPEPETPSTLKDIFFYHNPITADVPVSALNVGKQNLQIVNTVEVNTTLGGTSFKPVLTTELEPDSGGIAEFFLNAAFRGYLNPSPPGNLDTTIMHVKNGITRFRYKHGEIYEDLTEPATVATKGDYLVILGGISKEQYPGIDFFNTYLPTTKKFLTWQPQTKTIDRNQEEFLYFLFWGNAAEYLAPFNLKAKVFYRDGTTDEVVTKTSGFFGMGSLIQIPAGLIGSGVLAIDPEKTVLKYDLWLENTNAAVISEVRTYIVEHDIHPYTRYFLFRNSLGGYDTVRSTGISAKDIKISKEEFEKSLPSDYSLESGQYAIFDSDYQNEYDVSSGFVSKSYADYLQDMLISPEVYEIRRGKRIPVIITNSSAQIDENKKNMWYVRFDIKAAYRNKVYTPDL